MKLQISMLWIKVWRDLWETRVRTLATILILAFGSFAINTVIISMVLIRSDMDRGYKNSNPANVILRTPAAKSEKELTRIRNLIASVPGIESMDLRREMTGRIKKTNGTWKTLRLIALDDPMHTSVDVTTIESGSIKGSVIGIERAALTFLKAKEKDNVMINISGMPVAEFPIAATVHAPGLAPSWMEQTAYAFVDRSVEPWKNLPFGEEIWRIRIKQGVNPQQSARKMEALLQKTQITPVIWEAPSVVRHPHASQMDTLLLMLQSFSLLCFILCLTLGAIQLNRTLSAQTRQIAVLRAVGASPAWLWSSYLFYAGIMAVTALGASIPLSAITGSAYASFALNLLNFNMSVAGASVWLYVFLGLAGIILPLAAAWLPVRNAMARSIRESLQETDVTDSTAYNKVLNLPISISVLYAIRTSLRKPLRAIFTVLLLAAGGACLLTAANVQTSMDRTVEKQFESVRYDSMLVLTKGINPSIKSFLSAIQDVEVLEAWSASYGAAKFNRDGWSEKMRILGIPENSVLKIPPRMENGTWLSRDSPDAMVANQVAAKIMGNPKIGDHITIRFGNVQRNLVLAGIVTELMSPPLLYVSQQQGDPWNFLVVVGKRHDIESTTRLETTIEEQLPAGVKVQMTMPTLVFKKVIIDHLLILATFLVFISVLVLVAGGLSLSSALAMTIRERSREWALLRSIGAGPTAIYAILLWESIVYGIFGAVLGFLASLPLGWFLSKLFGESFFSAPLVFGISMPGIMAWVLFLFLLCIGSSIVPAMQVLRQPVVDGLQYE